MQRANTRSLSATAIAAVAALVLAACGGSSDEGASASPSISLPPAAMSSTAAETGDAVVGGDAATWSPVLVKKKTKSVELVPGQMAILPAFEYRANPNFVAVSSDPAVVEVLEADAQSVVTIHAVGVGEAVVKVYRGTETGGQGKYLRKVKVSVIEQ